MIIGCSIGQGGIIICQGQNGPSGDAMVRFEDRESQETALGYHKKNMGQRFVLFVLNIHNSTLQEKKEWDNTRVHIIQICTP